MNATETQFKGKKIHLVGVKGIGLSAAAQFLKKQGAFVSGSDSAAEFPCDGILKKSGILIKPFSGGNITRQTDLVVYSSAYNQRHPEIKKAEALGIPLKSYGELLGEIFNRGKNKIAVAGSHGKTTTAALVGHLLVKAGWRPTVFLGGVSRNFRNNFKPGKLDWVVAEADEYQKKFLFLKPDYLLLTNIDYDHPDCFKNRRDYRLAFRRLEKQTVKVVLAGEPISPSFRKFLAKIEFPLWGEKNKENGFLVYRLAKKLRISDAVIKKAFESFKGVSRRMEIHLEKSGLTLIDDYGHHPAEIKATLSALRGKYPLHKILAVFQPHTFSRSAVLLKEFGGAFQNADFICLLPTYGSAREARPESDIDGMLFREIKKHSPAAEFCDWDLARPRPLIDKIVQLKKRHSRLIVLTMGAGNVNKLISPIIKSF